MNFYKKKNNFIQYNLSLLKDYKYPQTKKQIIIEKEYNFY